MTSAKTTTSTMTAIVQDTYGTAELTRNPRRSPPWDSDSRCQYDYVRLGVDSRPREVTAMGCASGDLDAVRYRPPPAVAFTAGSTLNLPATSLLPGTPDRDGSDVVFAGFHWFPGPALAVTSSLALRGRARSRRGGEVTDRSRGGNRLAS
jgi:hypothetical protein